ncbi:Alpha/Beta hydrolase protein [Trametes gibbosa]|nr:Alpha/Beta hydrolase protein [Trametes gibbosa]
MDSDFAPTFPPPEPYNLPTSHPKDLVPIDPETLASVERPNLPSPPRKSPLDTWYTLSTHLIPCASPKTTPDVPLPQLPKWSPNKDKYKASVKKTAEAILSLKEKQWRGELDGLPRGRKQMWNCVNRYVRKLRAGEVDGVVPNGITLFCSHANGFTKEIWEPALRRLVGTYEAQANYTVCEIWSWEARNHGDSALLNHDQLDGLFDWRDNTRDILNFLWHYLPPTVAPDTLPTHLARLSEVEVDARRAHGLQSRNMVYVGHSFGGCSIVRAAIAHPVLFKHIILVDAMILPAPYQQAVSTEATRNYVIGAVQRRDEWSSHEEALKQFSTIPFFQAWDPAVLDVYLECGLYETTDGKVKLKMPRIQEAICFSENYAPFECFELLSTLDERIELRWLVAGRLTPYDHMLRRKLVWRRPANSSHVRMFSAGHLITQEAPADLAKEIHEFLTGRYGSPKAML